VEGTRSPTSDDEKNPPPQTKTPAQNAPQLRRLTRPRGRPTANQLKPAAPPGPFSLSASALPPVDNFLIEVDIPVLGRKSLMVNARRLQERSNGTQLTMLAFKPTDQPLRN